MTNRVAKTLGSDSREIIERIRSKEVVNVDKTGIKVNKSSIGYRDLLFKKMLVVIKDSRGK
jgi:hypothetical protein